MRKAERANVNQQRLCEPHHHEVLEVGAMIFFVDFAFEEVHQIGMELKR